MSGVVLAGGVDGLACELHDLPVAAGRKVWAGVPGERQSVHLVRKQVPHRMSAHDDAETQPSFRPCPQSHLGQHCVLHADGHKEHEDITGAAFLIWHPPTKKFL